MVLQNISWQLGNDSQINFWTSHWISQPLVCLLHILEYLHHNLSAKVKDIIQEGAWHILDISKNQYPGLENELQQIRVAKFSTEDQMV